MAIAEGRPRVGFVPVGRSLPQLRSAAAALESLGVDSLWAPGHIATSREVPEAMTGLAALAAVSERATVGTAVLLAPLYHPVIVAKQAAELDRLTGGRVALGLGVGGEYPAEFRGCQVDPGDRGPRTDEAIDVMRSLWSGAEVDNPTSLTAEDHRRALNGEEHLLASCGRPMGQAAVKILDGGMSEVPAGETGEMCIRSGYTMRGYWRNEEATREAFAGGWLHSGDLARRDEEGYIYLVDRKKDLIISGGQNVYSTEVEQVIGQMPAVAETAVVGVPDELWGERVTAVVVRKPGSDLTERDVIAACRDRLAGYKSPKQVHFWDELPRNVLGKTLKRDIRAALSGSIAAPEDEHAHHRPLTAGA